MLKALLRKQLLEIRNVYLTGGNRRKQQKSGNSKGFYITFILLYVVLMGSMFAASMGVGSVLIPAGLDFMYFTIMGILAFLIGIIGSVLSTSQALFRSKDNELLLSMPIPSSRIVFVRMISVYLIGFLYSAIVLLPAVVFYFIAGEVTVLSVIFCFLGIIVFSFLVTAFSCGAGWLVSLIATKLKNQKILLVVIIVILIGGIYYFQFRSSYIIRSMVEHAQDFAGYVNGPAYPVFAPGLAMTGKPLAFLVFLVITALLFGLAYFAVSKSFSRIALDKGSEKKGTFHGTDIKASAVSKALFRRELKRFLSSISYMLNAGLGILLLLAGAVIVLLKMHDIRLLIAQIGSSFSGIDNLLPVVSCAAVCVLTGTCVMSSCSISMEGKQLWVYQTMPLNPYRIIRAKTDLHLVLTLVPALLCTLALGICMQVSFPAFLAMLVFVSMFVFMSASLGIMMDLKKPKLDWTNENQALKTNVTVFVFMMIMFLAPGVIGVLYLLLLSLISPLVYLVFWIAVFAAVSLLVHRWLKGKGSEIFRTLS